MAGHMKNVTGADPQPVVIVIRIDEPFNFTRDRDESFGIPMTVERD
jgi:hypothetical protein